MKINSNRLVNIIIAIISSFLVLYTGYRAATLSFVFDESLSFNLFVPLKYIDIITYRVAVANNHMLNSLCLKFISQVFGTSEFLLRFPSLLSHLAYIVFTYLICKKMSSPIIVLAGFIVLNSNPYLLDFFSLARGYAMAISFTVISIYYLFNYIENKKNRDILLSFVFAALAVLSNFTLLLYFVSLFSVINIYWLVNQEHFDFKALYKKNIPSLYVAFSLLVLIFGPIRKLLKNQEFYDGGIDGFWNDTVGSLVNFTLYGKSYVHFSPELIKTLIAVSLILMFLYLLYTTYIKKWQVFSEKFTVALLLLVLTCAVSVLQHYLVNSKFPINRMALFFVPLYFIPVLILFSECASLKIGKVVPGIIVLMLAGVLSMNAYNSFNTSHTLHWMYDANTKEMLTDLEKQKNIDGKSSVSIGGVWLFKQTIKFYRTTKYKWINEVSNDYFKSAPFDYYFLADSNMTFINTYKKTIIKHYPLTNNYLVK